MTDYSSEVEQTLGNNANALTQHASAHTEAHELPNLITFLDRHFPDSVFVQFLQHWENILFSLAVAALISFVAIRAAHRQSLIPRGLQNFVEAIVEFVENFVTGILGEQGRRHVPFLGTIFIYILLMNWSGLVPFMKSPTSRWSVTLALALFTMVYIQVSGIRAMGLAHYLKHMAGNPSNLFGIVLIPLMLVLNLILDIGAVPFSLSLRLFANISSEDRLLLNFADLALTSNFLSFPLQLFANILAIVFSLVQAFVFMLLSTVYLSLITPQGGEGHEGQPAHDNHELQSAVKGD